jgi:nitroimidazol reductase NimA-like FMN-containing flavoprotein (pyridoxamine 5'-phosphate oxidase superfamily)
MRRNDRALDLIQTIPIIDESPYATLCMYNGKTPYCVAISPVREGMHLYFHCAREGEKLDCLAVCPDVCLNFVSKADPLPEEYTVSYCSAVVQGRAAEVTDTTEKRRALRLIAEKYAASFLSKLEDELTRWEAAARVFRIEMHEITGKKNP